MQEPTVQEMAKGYCISRGISAFDLRTREAFIAGYERATADARKLVELAARGCGEERRARPRD